MIQSQSPSRVIKFPDFDGRLSKRPLYVYLPPGYDDQPERAYPILYMHDGQNCFQAYVQDSYVGSWRADETADDLIQRGLMRPCLIVGVSHGGEERLAEYLPPQFTYRPRRTGPLSLLRKRICGRAGKTFHFYRDDVAPFIRRRFRLLDGRDHTATCGSSMGGLFSLYIAWEHPEFARHHAALSPAFSVTHTLRGSRVKGVEWLGQGQQRDVRIWLDSGTQTSPGQGDDGRSDTAAARDALLAHGYQIGPDFQYLLDEGASHNEAAWAARLPRVFQFLFPPNPGGSNSRDSKKGQSG